MSAETDQPGEKTGSEVSATAIVFFLLAIISLALTIFLGQSVAWFLEQAAILSTSAASVAVSGKIWFVAQAAIIIFVVSIFFFFSHNALRAVYQSWLLAVLVTIPALGLRFLGPNQDQIGALAQTVLGLIGGGIILLLRRRSLSFELRPALVALALIPFAIWPFLLWGSPGSPADIFLNLLAGLAFGLLATSLMAKTTGNFLLDGLGTGALLCILGSAFGYDGGQLMLITMLPTFGFAAAAFAPSVPGLVVWLGLLTATPLILTDPTELDIVLGDFFQWAALATFVMAFNGLLIGLALWLWGKWNSRPQSIFIPVGLVAWIGAFTLYALFGLHGFHGDRLFVILKEQADLTPAAQIKDATKRKAAVYTTLTETATRTQSDIRQTLERFHIGYTPYYLVNALEVDDNLLVRLYLASRPEVDRVLASPRLHPLPQKPQAEPAPDTSIRENPGWNIKLIGADKVWDEFKVTGQGIVVGQSDTGVDGQHPALSSSYRGKSSGSDYNWYDPWNHTTAPTDGIGHGTHTLGTILGQGGIGVAPGAQWIACVNLDRNLGNPAVYLDCMQFDFAPFPQNGDSFKGDPARGAQVFNNSWGCPPLEGCDADALKPAADALRTAGVFVVVSTGNDGPLCETVADPLSLYDSVFSVGAVDSQKDIAAFSSRGPVTVDGSGRIKPDIVAPGENVFSSLPGGSYGAESGTSMAGPHLVGVVALMWSANPALIGDIDRTEQILIQTANASAVRTPSSDCAGTEVPNNTSGYGLVDAYAAVKMALGK